jgi:cell division protein ZipA
MNELRWILIGFGFVLIAGIYLWGRRSVGGEAMPVGTPSRGRPEPHVAPLPDDLGTPAEPIEDVAAHSLSTIHVEPRSSNERTFSTTVAVPVIDDEASIEGDPGARVEPLLGEGSGVADAAGDSARWAVAGEAPTLSTSESPQPRRIERRKILSLRLSAATATKLDGNKLLEALKAESLVHGKYDVFHRLHTDGSSVFSVASMVEPGTFDVAKMPQTQYPGVTLFAQLPGPVAGMYALNELVACAKRLQQNLAGTLQDDRGIPLTVHRIERMRQEVREFERPAAAAGARSSLSQSASP